MLKNISDTINDIIKDDTVVCAVKYNGVVFALGFTIEDYKMKRNILVQLERMVETQLDCLILGLKPEELALLPYSSRPGVQPSGLGALPEC